MRKFTKNASEVAVIDWDHVIQTFAANRTDDTLAVGIRHRTSNGSPQNVQIKPVQCFIHFGRENCIAVMNDIAVTSLPVHELAELLQRPLCRGMIGHVAVQNATRTNLDGDKHVQPGTLPSPM
jgi:hypothetical protein